MIKINSEDKKKIPELRALYYLQFIMKERYANLKHIGGNSYPDLQDDLNSIGVEVTTANRGQEMEFYFNEFCDKDFSEIPDKINDKIRNNGYILGGVDSKVKILLGPYATELTTPDDLSQKSAEKVIDAFDSKLEKLNGSHPNIFNNNEVFIYADMALMDNNIPDIVKIASSHQECSKHKFSMIHIHRSWDIFTCDVSSGNIQRHSIESATSTIFMRVAKELGITVQQIKERVCSSISEEV